MFGSDASMWPQVIGIGIEAIASADLLSEAQERDILYNNAARFLRIDEKRQPQSKPRSNSKYLPRGSSNATCCRPNHRNVAYG